MGCTSLINPERRQSKTVACQGVALNLSEPKIDIPLVVAEDAVCPQALKDRLIAALRQAVASSAVGHRLMLFTFETLCPLFSHLVLGQLVLRASFESDHFA